MAIEPSPRSPATIVRNGKSEEEYKASARSLAKAVNDATVELAQYFPAETFSDTVTKNVIEPLESVANGSGLKKTVNGVSETVTAEELMAAIDKLRDLAMTSQHPKKHGVGIRQPEETLKINPSSKHDPLKTLIAKVDRVRHDPDFSEFLRQKEQHIFIT